MGENSKIAWCDHSFNSWIGCTKVSPACLNCYAEAYGRRFGVEWGPGKPRKRTSEANWKKPLAWDRKAAKLGIRYRVFCASLADVFDPEVPGEWRYDLFALTVQTPNLDWLLLTKRAKEMRAYMMALTSCAGGKTLPNVWLGVTAENQEQADIRIPSLLATPAAKRFVSIEPMLGPVDLPEKWLGPHSPEYHEKWGRCNCPSLDWVICGSESGPKRRHFDVDWPRSLRDQCQAAGVAFFFKQGPGGPPPKGVIETPMLDGRTWTELP